MVRRQTPRPDPMDTPMALLDERKRAAMGAYDSIFLERAITGQAEAVLRCASRAALGTIRRLAREASAGAQGTT